MSYHRLVLILILLITGSIHMYASVTDQPHFAGEVESHFSEDSGDLSPGHLSISKDSFKNRVAFHSISFKGEENTREYSKAKAYFLTNRFIEPGLNLSAIIFPFHIFL